MSLFYELILATVLAAVILLNWRIAWEPALLRIGVSVGLFCLLTLQILRVGGMPAAPVLDPDMRIAIWQRGLIALWWLLGARLAVGVLPLVFWRNRESSHPKIASDLLAGLIYLAAVLAIVNFVFDLPVRALLATSGIIAVVLALALQNTLADVFAGIAVGIEHPYVVGDRIGIDGSFEGVIVQINWRSIHVRTDGNDIVTIPNSLIAKSRVTNRSRPSTRRDDSLQVACDSTARPDLVLEYLRHAALLTPQILASPPPASTLARIGARTNSYDIAFSVAHTDHLAKAKSALLAQALRQFHYHAIRPVNPGALSTPIGPVQVNLGPVETLPPEQLLADIPLFRELSPKQRSDMARHMIRRHLEATTTLVSQGGAPSSFMVVASGVLEVSRTIRDHSHVVGRFGPGDYFGELGVITGVPSPGTVLALTRCIVFELRKEDLDPVLAAEPGLAEAFEASVRRGQAFLARDEAAAIQAQPGPPAQFLAQIRAFFKT